VVLLDRVGQREGDPPSLVVGDHRSMFPQRSMNRRAGGCRST
jgi:hypothetical protein